MIHLLFAVFLASSVAHAGKCSDFLTQFLKGRPEVLPFENEEQFLEHFDRGGTFRHVTTSHVNFHVLGVVVDTEAEGRIQMFDLTERKRLTPQQMQLEMASVDVVKGTSRTTGETFWVKSVDVSRHIKAVLFDTSTFDRMTVESLVEGPYRGYKTWRRSFIADIIELADGTLLDLKIVIMPQQQIVFEIKKAKQSLPEHEGVVVKFRRKGA